MAYRRRHNSDTWHWCRNCSRWPVTDYERRDKPATANPKDLCNECKAKEHNGDCRNGAGPGHNATPPAE